MSVNVPSRTLLSQEKRFDNLFERGGAPVRSGGAAGATPLSGSRSMSRTRNKAASGAPIAGWLGQPASGTPIAVSSEERKYDDLFVAMSSDKGYERMGSGRIMRSKGFTDQWRQTVGF
jgi:hypothetical protein